MIFFSLIILALNLWYLFFMRRIIRIGAIVFLFSCSTAVLSQTVVEVVDKANEETAVADSTGKGVWIFEGRFQLSLNQAFSSNWVGSSNPFIGISTLDNLSLFYRKHKFTWESTLGIDFGMRHTFAPKGNNVKKNEKTSDRMDFTSQIGFKMRKDWYYGALLIVNTQLVEGRDPVKDSIKTSSFMSPGTITLPLGITYKHSMWSWYISPVAAILKTKIDPLFYTQEMFGVAENKKTRLSVGAFTYVSFAADIHPKINLNTKLELFYDYMGEYEQMRNTNVNFDMTWRFSVTEWLSITLRMRLLYDYNTRFSVYDSDGEKIDGITTDHLQFQETFGLTLGYKFKLPKKK